MQSLFLHYFGQSGKKKKKKKKFMGKRRNLRRYVKILEISTYALLLQAFSQIRYSDAPSAVRAVHLAQVARGTRYLSGPSVHLRRMSVSGGYGKSAARGSDLVPGRRPRPGTARHRPRGLAASRGPFGAKRKSKRAAVSK